MSKPVIKNGRGLVVASGFIDIHVHLREAGFGRAETIEPRGGGAAMECAQ